MQDDEKRAADRWSAALFDDPYLNFLLLFDLGSGAALFRCGGALGLGGGALGLGGFALGLGSGGTALRVDGGLSGRARLLQV